MKQIEPIVTHFPVSKLKPLDIGGEMSQQMCCFYRFKFAVRSVDYPLIVQVVAFEVEALFKKLTGRRKLLPPLSKLQKNTASSKWVVTNG